MFFILALLKALLLHQGFETIKNGSSVFNEKLHIIELSNNSKLQIIENSAFYQSSIEYNIFLLTSTKICKNCFLYNYKKLRKIIYKFDSTIEIFDESIFFIFFNPKYFNSITS